MREIRIKPTTTWQKPWDKRRIRFSQTQKKIILYHGDSIVEYKNDMFEKHFKMEENIKVDEKFKRAFNLGYEVAKELNLKTLMLLNETSDII